MPDPDQASLEVNSAEYTLAICSVDVVHVRLWNVASNLKQVSTGKEKFQVVLMSLHAIIGV